MQTKAPCDIIIYMISRRTHNHLTWIDLNRPTYAEIEDLMSEFSIHPVVAEALLEPTLHPKVEEYGDILYLVMHFPTIQKGKYGSDQIEIDFVLGKNFLITTHYENSEPLRNSAKEFEVSTILTNSTTMSTNPGYLFFHIIKSLYLDMQMELQTLRGHTKTIENMMFNGSKEKIVAELSEIAHKLLDFRESTRFHKSILLSFEQSSVKFYGLDFKYNAELLTAEYYKLWEILENLRETVIELKKTNDSLLAFKTNETIRFLTLFTFIALPLQIIPDIFTTNVFIEGKYSSHIVHFSSIFLSLLLFLYCRFRKWI